MLRCEVMLRTILDKLEGRVGYRRGRRGRSRDGGRGDEEDRGMGGGGDEGDRGMGGGGDEGDQGMGEGEE